MARQRKMFTWLCQHSLVSFLLLTLSFVVFGKLSFDIVHLFSANAEYLLDNGWAGMVDGGLQQLLELILSVCAAMAAYMLFKLCEQALLERMRHQHD
jgi:hypothetical protein